jgi:hypothetical protein
MATITFYVPGDPGSGNAFRARLNAIAGELGYSSPGGPTKGQGSITQLLLAIDNGEVAVVFLSDEERRRALATLNALHESDPVRNEWANSVLHALERALHREHAADRNSVFDDDPRTCSD